MSRSGIGLYLSYVVPVLLQNSAFDCHVLVHDSNEIERELRKAITVIETKRSPFSIHNLFGLHWLRSSYDVAWFPHFCVPFFFTKPFVATIHDLLPLDVPSSIHGLHAQWLAKRMFASVASRAKSIIVPTKFTANRWAAHFPHAADKTKQIYNPFDATRFVSTPASEPLSLRDLPSKFALFVGNLKQHKRFDIARSEAARRGLPLVVIGASNNSLRSTADPTSLVDVVYLGEVSDAMLVAAIQRAQVVLHPSEYEGYGYVPALARALGVHIVCAKIPAIEEVYGNSVAYFTSEVAANPGNDSAQFRHSTPQRYVQQLAETLCFAAAQKSSSRN
jgi:glycosyltransferase involved in cell wall biosynthesis